LTFHTVKKLSRATQGKWLYFFAKRSLDSMGPFYFMTIMPQKHLQRYFLICVLVFMEIQPRKLVTLVNPAILSWQDWAGPNEVTP
jgi:hypothetical protein